MEFEVGTEINLGNTPVRTYLRGRIPIVFRGVLPQMPRWLSTRATGRTAEYDVSTLIERIAAAKIANHAPPKKRVCVEGMLSPCVLLYRGWWEDQSKTQEQRRASTWARMRTLQGWLGSGFEEWGPSWDVSTSACQKKGDYVFAQLASRDEADSVPLIVHRSKLRGLPFPTARDWPVISAALKGDLCHKSCISDYIEKETCQSLVSSANEYFVLVDESCDDHRIKEIEKHGKANSYTGYLWVSVVPERLVKPGRPVKVEDTYFVWEHTDFTIPDALHYNLSALKYKLRYLKEQLNSQARASESLVLLQKSHSIIPNSIVGAHARNIPPKYTQDEFYRYLLKGK